MGAGDDTADPESGGGGNGGSEPDVPDEDPTDVPDDATADSDETDATGDDTATSQTEPPASGGPRTMGYVGCSMSDNVADGYGLVGGERLWPSLPAYWGKVVQNWADPSDAVWDTFDAQVDMYGVPSAIWIMVCIFNPPGVNIDEMRTIVDLVRQRAPEAMIYMTGQPLYEPGAECSIAGNDGPGLTDDMAQQVADDESLANIEYAGTFGPLSAGQKADACHANDSGKRLLGEQAAEKWGM